MGNRGAYREAGETYYQKTLEEKIHMFNEMTIQIQRMHKRNNR